MRNVAPSQKVSKFENKQEIQMSLLGKIKCEGLKEHEKLRPRTKATIISLPRPPPSVFPGKERTATSHKPSRSLPAIGELFQPNNFQNTECDRSISPSFVCSFLSGATCWGLVFCCCCCITLYLCICLCILPVLLKPAYFLCIVQMHAVGRSVGRDNEM